MVQMEHRGRFATGCLQCRERKIKGDETKPSCNRCLKGRYTCPGYRKLTDITFRNQNMIVARNARREWSENARVAKVGTSTSQAYASSHSLENKPPTLSSSINMDLESVARSYFLSCHVIAGSKTLVRGQFDFLSDFLARPQQIDPAIQHSLNAASFAAFGNFHNELKLLRKSRVECNLAIQAVNTALQYPDTAAKDSTLVAAMLLSTFETITYVYQPEPETTSCIDQLTGCLALLVIRVPKQLDTRSGFHIFLQAYFLVVSACIHREHALPPQLSMLRSYMQPYLDAGDCSLRILELLARFADLMGGLKNQNHEILYCHQHLITIAMKLDDDFQAMESSMPPNWRYQTFQCSDPVLVYKGIYHIYHEAWVIRYWNYIRLCRILLYRIILDFHSPALSLSSMERESRLMSIAQLSTDICATVPQHAGYLGLLQPQQTGNSISSKKGISAQRDTGVYAAGIYSLLWPLFTIGRMKDTPVRHREWIINRLEYLGGISGISQAFAAAETMRSEKSL